MAGKIVTITREDAVELPVYTAPHCEAGGSLSHKPAVIVLQEWWGLNEQIKSKVDRFALAGFRAVIPDLYRGQVAQNAQEAGHLMNGLDWPSALKDLQTLIDHLHNTGSSAVGITGFCMGGALTLLAASNLRGLKAAVPFYGIPPQMPESKIFVPVLGHFAKHDDWCTVEKVNALADKLKAANANFEFHIYDGHHAFCNEKRPEVYNAALCQQAMDRTFAFFGRHLL